VPKNSAVAVNYRGDSRESVKNMAKKIHRFLWGSLSETLLATVEKKITFLRKVSFMTSVGVER